MIGKVRRLSVALFLLLALLLTSFLLPNSRVVATSNARDQDIEHLITDSINNNHIPGLSVAVVQQNNLIYLKGYGQADADHTATPQTSFRIGNISKSFTATAIMQLVEQHQIELDAPVRRYLAWFQVADTNTTAHLTIRQLLNQTSGLPASNPDNKQIWDRPEGSSVLSPEEVVRSLKTIAPAHAPGVVFENSNLNFIILATILETVTHQSYGQYIEQHIFQPLQMSNSHSDEQSVPLAQGYRLWFGIPVAHTVPFQSNQLAASFLNSTAEDLSHYLIAQLNQGAYKQTQLLSPASMKELQAPGVAQAESDTTYAMGLTVSSTSNHDLRLWNADTSSNFSSVLLFSPTSGYGVAILANISGLSFGFTGEIERLGMNIINILEGKSASSVVINANMFYLFLASLLTLMTLPTLISWLHLKRWQRGFVRRIQKNPHNRLQGFRLILRLCWEIGMPVLLAVRFLTPMNLINYPDLFSWLCLYLGLLAFLGLARLLIALYTLVRKPAPVVAIQPA